METGVAAWEEWVELPTYETGKPEKNPLFLEKRVYQGSSGVVYPHPVIEKICNEKTTKRYRAFFIENEYLKIMVLPQLGGRVHRAYDKTRKRDFVYYNQVIKPALVGLTGPWISGGIEFNWPQHHRPSTFLPVDCTIEAHSDGSKTLWMSEVEVMFRTKGAAGFTLYPGKAYLEVKGKVFNRTNLPQSFLWWANPAVRVNDHYQSVFPPDVHAVFDHGKRGVSDFPIATGTYYKVNYAPGTDISRYKNIPVPTSYMAVQSSYDFIGCYEHDTQAGMVHIADHHISPGKKQWTWGNGDFGKAWDKNLTDEDGPYAELMTGVFTDNQPDFTWLQPNEQKDFEQYFLPYTGTGGIRNATKEAVINVDIKDDTASVKVYATSVHPTAKIRFFVGDDLLASFLCRLSPAEVFDKTIDLPPGCPTRSIKIIVAGSSNDVLVSFEPEPETSAEMPAASSPALLPGETGSVEQLYFTGLHLEQYRHASFYPEDYYREGLRRDPGDSRCNNAMGLWLLRKGQFEKAEPFLRNAIQSITERNSNPPDGGPWFNLGYCLQLQGRFDEAYAAFYKSAWSDAWQHSAFLALARIAIRQGKWENASTFINKSLARNNQSQTTRHLKIILLRKTGRQAEAARLIKTTLQEDPFSYGVLFERYLLLAGSNQKRKAAGIITHLKSVMGNPMQTVLEYALDYANAGLYKEGAMFIEALRSEWEGLSPMPLYYLGWLLHQQKDIEGSKMYYQQAGQVPADYCFPNKIEEILILTDAIHLSPQAKTYYYLGNLWYDKRQYPEAIECWEESAKLDHSFPTVHRNLTLAYFNKKRDSVKALASLEAAFALDHADARVLMELDQLYKIVNKPVALRLDLLEKNIETVNQRDDLCLERITLLNLSGRYEAAAELLASRRFHPWEGGEGRVTEQYAICLTELAKQAIHRQKYEEALALLSSARQYPENLGEGKLPGKPENDIDYLCGCACLLLGRHEDAMAFFGQAAKGSQEPEPAIFYNDPQPDKIFYQGLAWYRLGFFEKAESVFKRLTRFGEEHINDIVRIDYFAVSLPDLAVFDKDLQQLNRTHCYYLQALGYLGLGDAERADAFFLKVKELQNHHIGAGIHAAMNEFLKYTAAIPSVTASVR